MGKVTLAAGAAILGLSIMLAGCQRREATEETTAADAAATTETAEAPAAGRAAPVRGPTLRAGLWQVTTSIEGVGAAPATRMCVDAGMQAEMAVIGQSDPRCQATRMQRTADGWSFASRCDMGSAGQTEAEGVATGDFQSRYETRVTTRTSGAEVPHMNREMRMTSVAVWQGPCPDGWRPGDVETPVGRMNMVEMAAGARAAGR